MRYSNPGYITLLSTKEDNLDKLYPKLAKEWHPSKNEGMTPEDVTRGSGRKVWWRCEKGHEWQARIADRTQESGCPQCYKKNRREINRKVALKRSGSLANRYPDLARQWHSTKNGELTPYDVTPGSNRKAWWKCNQGHKWQATIANRANGTGCSKCYREKRGELFMKAVAKRRGSLADKFPDLAKEWHPTKNRELTPNDVVPGSHMRVWWICDQGHEWIAEVRSRAIRGTGCLKCYRNRKGTR